MPYVSVLAKFVRRQVPSQLVGNSIDLTIAGDRNCMTTLQCWGAMKSIEKHNRKYKMRFAFALSRLHW